MEFIKNPALCWKAPLVIGEDHCKWEVGSGLDQAKLGLALITGDIWDNVGAQMALSSVDLRYPTLGRAAARACLYELCICAYSSALTTLQGPVAVAHFKQADHFPVAFSSLSHSEGLFLQLRSRLRAEIR